jgi:prepilin-type N-terminal cleavage/methylation domain-containing protein
MNKASLSSRRGFRKGFTLLELLVVSILVVMLMLITTQFWTWFSPSIAEMVAREHLLREARIAMQSLAADFGSVVGVTLIGTDRIILCKDSGDLPNGLADWAAPDILVDYAFVDNTLRRSDSAGADFTVADCVSNFTADPGPPLTITLEFQGKGDSRSLVFMWSEPNEP